MVGTFIEELKTRGILKKEANPRLTAMGVIAVHDGLLIWEVAGMNRQEPRKAFVEIIQTMFSSLLVHPVS